MAIKFLLDNAQKKEEALVNEILQTIKAKPPVDEAAIKLATFVDVVFRTAAGTRIEKIEVPKQKEQNPQLFKQSQGELEKKEYLVKLFDNPVGILIEKNDKTEKYKYRVMEPQPNPEVIDAVKDAIKKDFQNNHRVLEDKLYLQAQTAKACKALGRECDADLVRRTSYYLKRDLLGFRRLDPLMHDMNVIAIHCEGINKPVKVEYRGLHDKIETNVMFIDPHDLNALINKIARFVKAQISQSNPIMDVEVNGFKIQATLGMGGISSKLMIRKLNLPQDI